MRPYVTAAALAFAMMFSPFLVPSPVVSLPEARARGQEPLQHDRSRRPRLGQRCGCSEA
jgi:hypothetical protein